MGEGRDEWDSTGGDDSSSSSRSGSSGRDKIKAAGREANKAGVAMAQRASDEQLARSDRQIDTRPSFINVPSFKRGGVVRQTGLIRAHKGERVIPVGKVKSLRTTKKIKGVRKIKKTRSVGRGR